jgi:hypothetical protein
MAMPRSFIALRIKYRMITAGEYYETEYQCLRSVTPVMLAGEVAMLTK